MEKNIVVCLLTGILLVAGVFPLNQVIAQDISYFELLDNSTVGLTATPYTKWGMAIADIDRNGWPDIFVPRYNSPGHSRMFSNSDAFFQDITDQTPIVQLETEGDERRTFNAMWVDYDNDGDMDLSFGTPLALHLLENDNNTFTDVSDAVGFVGQKPPGLITEWWFVIGDWGDYDRDGDLDCVVSQVNNDNLYLFRNDNGQFTNVSTEAGLDSTTLAGKHDPSKHCWDVTFADFDLDGDPDLYSVDQFFKNDNGYFTEVTEELGFGDLTFTSYREFFDYDNDGDLDFFKATGDPSGDATNELWENQDGVFSNVSVDVGMGVMRDRVRCMTIGDMDNDGDQDVVLSINLIDKRDVVLVNEETEPGVRAFENVAEFVGVTKMGDRKGSAFFDYNMDGFLDIYVPSAEYSHALYHNTGNDGNWVGFILEGTVSNRDAVGSLVTLHTGSKMQIRHTVCSNGFLRQDNPYVHFGIGYATSIDSVVIQWQLGTRQVLTDVAINQYHQVIESGQTTAVQWMDSATGPKAFRLAQNYPNPFNPETNITYQIPISAQVVVQIYNLLGQKIRTLVNEVQSAGKYSVTWNGLSDDGSRAPSGVYVYRMQAGDFISTKKLLLIK
jgi:hypothetical protein